MIPLPSTQHPAGDVWRLDATAQAALVADGSISAVELVDAAIARIEALDPHLGAVVVPLFERARHQAASLHAPLPRFAGVPFLLKDASQEVAGTPHWVGSAALAAAGHRSATTTDLARRILDLGFVMVGKSNTPELSSGTTTEPSGMRPTANPWDPSRSAAGSSGGAAAAVAAGLVPVAHGADATGSLRFPASACGVLTLKPSRGRIRGLAPAGMSDPLGIWCEMVLTRTTRDLAAVFEDLSEPVDRPPAPAGPGVLRVGLLAHDALLGLPVRDECRAAVALVGRHLEALGCEVSWSHPAGLDHLFADVQADISIVSARGRFEQRSWVRSRLGGTDGHPALSEQLEAEAEVGATITDDAVRTSVGRIRAAVASVETWWDRHDVLVTPVMRRPAWPLGRDAVPALAGVFPAPFSFTGQPALSVPAAWTDAGLPVGVQLVGARGADEVLLGLSAALEGAIGWTTRWPAMAEDAA